MHDSPFERARFWASVAAWGAFLIVMGTLGFNLFVQLEQALGPIREALT